MCTASLGRKDVDVSKYTNMGAGIECTCTCLCPVTVFHLFSPARSYSDKHCSSCSVCFAFAQAQSRLLSQLMTQRLKSTRSLCTGLIPTPIYTWCITGRVACFPATLPFRFKFSREALMLFASIVLIGMEMRLLCPWDVRLLELLVRPHAILCCAVVFEGFSVSCLSFVFCSVIVGHTLLYWAHSFLVPFIVLLNSVWISSVCCSGPVPFTPQWRSVQAVFTVPVAVNASQVTVLLPQLTPAQIEQYPVAVVSYRRIDDAGVWLSAGRTPSDAIAFTWPFNVHDGSYEVRVAIEDLNGDLLFLPPIAFPARGLGMAFFSYTLCCSWECILAVVN